MEAGSQSPKSVALNQEQEEHVQALARSMSHSESVTQLPTLGQTTTRISQHSKYVNPFHDTEGDETLDPRSEKFDIHAWLKSVMQIASRDPENFPVRFFAPFCRVRLNFLIDENGWCFLPKSQRSRCWFADGLSEDDRKYLARLVFDCQRLDGHGGWETQNPCVFALKAVWKFN